MPRTIEYYVATSIDGFIAAEDGSYDMFTPDEEQLSLFLDRIRSAYDAVVMGRATFDVGRAQGVLDPYPWLDTHVVSSSLAAETVPNVTVHDRPAHAVVTDLRSGDGGAIWICGGGVLAGSLLTAGLLDRVVLKRYPVTLGRGVPLFGTTVRRPLRLETSTAYPSGVVVDEYAVG